MQTGLSAHFDVHEVAVSDPQIAEIVHADYRRSNKEYDADTGGFVPAPALVLPD